MKHSKHRLNELKSWARPGRSPVPEAEQDEIDRSEHHNIADVSWHARHTLMKPMTAPKVLPTRPNDYGTNIVVSVANPVTPTKVAPPHRDMGTDIFVDGMPFVPPGATDIINVADPVTPTKVAPPHRDMGTDIFVDGQPYVPPGATDVIVTILDTAKPTKAVPPYRDMGTDIFVDGQPYVPSKATDIITSTTTNIGGQPATPTPEPTPICIYEPRPPQLGSTRPVHITEIEGPVVLRPLELTSRDTFDFADDYGADQPTHVEVLDRHNDHAATLALLPSPETSGHAVLICIYEPIKHADKTAHVEDYFHFA